MKLPSIRVYTPETGISTSQSRLKTARPTEGLPTFAAQEMALMAQMRAMEDLIENMWPRYSVWQIAATCKISARHVWGIHQRLDRAKREEQTITVTSGEKV